MRTRPLPRTFSTCSRSNFKRTRPDLFSGPAGLSRRFAMQDGLLDLDVARVRFDEVGELIRVNATEEVGIAALLRDGALVKPSATKQSGASGTGLDVIIAADRAAPGFSMCDARACSMRHVACVMFSRGLRCLLHSQLQSTPRGRWQP